MDACPRGPKSFIFRQFSAKVLQNNMLVHPSGELVHPQANLGSATVNTLSLCFWAWGKSQAKITEILEKLGNLF